MNKNLAELHKELWMWIHDNPLKEKNSWPGWEKIKAETGFVGICFACAVSDMMSTYDWMNNLDNTDECSDCPLQWENNVQCNEENSSYGMWNLYHKLLTVAKNRYPDLIKKYTKEVKKYAKIIAETPWEGDTDYNILKYEEAGGEVKTMLTKEELKTAATNRFEKTKFYYIKDAEDKGRITVCLLKNGTRTARGLALCSMKDQPVKKIGRAKSFGRARKALYHETNLNLINRNDGIEVLLACGEHATFTYKSEYLPIFSEHEANLISD